MSGIGEIVEPLPHVDRTITLVIPPLRVSTPAAYRAWDELGGPTADGPNDLEPAALAVEPDCAGGAIDRRADRRAPVLAGSGATWFTEHGTTQRDNALGDWSTRALVSVVTSTADAPSPSRTID